MNTDPCVIARGFRYPVRPIPQLGLQQPAHAWDLIHHAVDDALTTYPEAAEGLIAVIVPIGYLRPDTENTR